jgi:hypothetical protein
MGDLFTIDRPVGSKWDGDEAELQQYANRASAALGSLRVLEPLHVEPYLAQSPDCGYVMFRWMGSEETDFRVLDAATKQTRSVIVKSSPN